MAPPTTEDAEDVRRADQPMRSILSANPWLDQATESYIESRWLPMAKFQTGLTPRRALDGDVEPRYGGRYGNQ
jgi:hypothetical protein